MNVQPHRFLVHALTQFHAEGVDKAVRDAISRAQWSARCFSESTARKHIASDAYCIRKLLGWKPNSRVFIID